MNPANRLVLTATINKTSIPLPSFSRDCRLLIASFLVQNQIAQDIPPVIPFATVLFTFDDTISFCFDQPIGFYETFDFNKGTSWSDFREKFTVSFRCLFPLGDVF